MTKMNEIAFGAGLVQFGADLVQDFGIKKGLQLCNPLKYLVPGARFELARP